MLLECTLNNQYSNLLGESIKNVLLWYKFNINYLERGKTYENISMSQLISDLLHLFNYEDLDKPRRRQMLQTCGSTGLLKIPRRQAMRIES